MATDMSPDDTSPLSTSLHGRWTLSSRDNVDAFLACRGVSWFVRAAVLSLRADLEFSPGEGPDSMLKRTHSALGLRQETLPCPGVYEPTKTLSGRPEVGAVFFEDGAVVQRMSSKESGEVVARVERRVLQDRLHVTFKCGDIVATEVYERVGQTV